jgi:hypothetical protein
MSLVLKLPGEDDVTDVIIKSLPFF